MPANRLALVDGNVFAWMEMSDKNGHDAKPERGNPKPDAERLQEVRHEALRLAEKGRTDHRYALGWA